MPTPRVFRIDRRNSYALKFGRANIVDLEDYPQEKL